MKKLAFLIAVTLVCCVGSHAATIAVPGGQPTIQAAVLAANDGDTIQIADGTYVEDVFVPGSTLLSKNNLTFEPAPGANVVIEAANTRVAGPATDGLYGVIMGLMGGTGQPDHHGFIIEGDGITLRDLTIRNMSTTGDVVIAEAATVQLWGDDCTIENCVLEANPDNESGRPIYIFTGNYFLLNPAIGAAGYGEPMTAANLTMTNCTLRYGDATFDTVDAALYLALALTASFIPEVHPSGTITDCEFIGGPAGGVLGEYDAGTFTFNNCHFHDGNDALDIGGGNWTYNECLFNRSVDDNLVNVEANPSESGPAIASATFNDCVFCGGSNDNRLVRCREGNVLFSGCIFNVTDTENVVAGIRYSPGDFEEDYGFLVPGGYPPSTSVTVDHCDFISPAGRGILGDEPQDIPGEPAGILTVTNSIFQCDQPIVLVGAAGVSPRTATVSNNNLNAGGVVDNPDGGWIVTETDNLNEIPGYVDPTLCPDPVNPDVYIYQNTALAGAGTDGSDLGSQGAAEPPASISDWNLYE